MISVSQMVYKRAKKYKGFSQVEHMRIMRQMLNGGLSSREINYWAGCSRSTRLMYLRMAEMNDVRYCESWGKLTDNERRVLRPVIRDHLEHGRREYEALLTV